MVTQSRAVGQISIMKIQYHLWDMEDFMKKYTSFSSNRLKHGDCHLRITIWLVKECHKNR